MTRHSDGRWAGLLSHPGDDKSVKQCKITKYEHKEFTHSHRETIEIVSNEQHTLELKPDTKEDIGLELR